MKGYRDVIHFRSEFFQQKCFVLIYPWASNPPVPPVPSGPSHSPLGSPHAVSFHYGDEVASDSENTAPSSSYSTTPTSSSFSTPAPSPLASKVPNINRLLDQLMRKERREHEERCEAALRALRDKDREISRLNALLATPTATTEDEAQRIIAQQREQISCLLAELNDAQARSSHEHAAQSAYQASLTSAATNHLEEELVSLRAENQRLHNSLAHSQTIYEEELTRLQERIKTPKPAAAARRGRGRGRGRGRPTRPARKLTSSEAAEKQAQEHTAAITKLEFELASLRTSVRLAEGRAERAEHELSEHIASAQQQIHHWKHRCEQLEKDAELNAHVAETYESSKEAHQAVEKLQAEAVEKSRMLASAQALVSELQEQLDAQRQELSSRDSNIRDLAEQLADAQDALKDQQAAQGEREDRDREHAEDRHRRERDLEQQVRELTEDVQHLEHCCRAALDQLQDRIKRDLPDLSSDISPELFHELFATLDEERDDDVAELRESHHRLTFNHAAKVEALEDEVREARASATITRAGSDESIRCLEETVRTLSLRSELHGELANVSAQLRTAKVRVAELEARCNAAGENERVFRQRAELYQSKWQGVAVEQDPLAAMHRRVELLTSDVDSYRSQLDDVTAENSNLDSKLAMLSAEHAADTEQQLAALQAQLSDASLEARRLRGELADAEARAEDALQRADAAHHDVTREREQWTAKLEAARALSDEERQRATLLGDELVEVRSHLVEAEQHNHVLIDTIEAMQLATSNKPPPPQDDTDTDTSTSDVLLSLRDDSTDAVQRRLLELAAQLAAAKGVEGTTARQLYRAQQDLAAARRACQAREDDVASSEATIAELSDRLEVLRAEATERRQQAEVQRQQLLDARREAAAVSLRFGKEEDMKKSALERVHLLEAELERQRSRHAEDMRRAREQWSKQYAPDTPPHPLHEPVQQLHAVLHEIERTHNLTSLHDLYDVLRSVEQRSVTAETTAERLQWTLNCTQRELDLATSSLTSLRSEYSLLREKLALNPSSSSSSPTQGHIQQLLASLSRQRLHLADQLDETRAKLLSTSTHSRSLERRVLSLETRNSQLQRQLTLQSQEQASLRLEAQAEGEQRLAKRITERDAKVRAYFEQQLRALLLEPPHLDPAVEDADHVDAVSMSMKLGQTVCGLKLTQDDLIARVEFLQRENEQLMLRVEAQRRALDQGKLEHERLANALLVQEQDEVQPVCGAREWAVAQDRVLSLEREVQRLTDELRQAQLDASARELDHDNERHRDASARENLRREVQHVLAQHANVTRDQAALFKEPAAQPTTDEPAQPLPAGNLQDDVTSFVVELTAQLGQQRDELIKTKGERDALEESLAEMTASLEELLSNAAVAGDQSIVDLRTAGETLLAHLVRARIAQGRANVSARQAAASEADAREQLHAAQAKIAQLSRRHNVPPNPSTTSASSAVLFLRQTIASQNVELAQLRQSLALERARQDRAARMLREPEWLPTLVRFAEYFAQPLPASSPPQDHADTVLRLTERVQMLESALDNNRTWRDAVVSGILTATATQPDTVDASNPTAIIEVVAKLAAEAADLKTQQADLDQQQAAHLQATAELQAERQAAARVAATLPEADWQRMIEHCQHIAEHLGKLFNSDDAAPDVITSSLDALRELLSSLDVLADGDSADDKTKPHFYDSQQLLFELAARAARGAISQAQSLRAVSDELASSREALSVANERLHSTADTLRELRTNTHELETARISVEDELERTQEAHQEALEEISSLSRQLETKERRASELADGLRKSRQRVADLEQELAEAQKQHGQLNDESNAREHQLQLEVSKLQAQVERAQSDVQRTQEQAAAEVQAARETSSQDVEEMSREFQRYRKTQERVAAIRDAQVERMRERFKDLVMHYRAEFPDVPFFASTASTSPDDDLPQPSSPPQSPRPPPQHDNAVLQEAQQRERHLVEQMGQLVTELAQREAALEVLEHELLTREQAAPEEPAQATDAKVEMLTAQLARTQLVLSQWKRQVRLEQVENQALASSLRTATDALHQLEADRVTCEAELKRVTKQLAKVRKSLRKHEQVSESAKAELEQAASASQGVVSSMSTSLRQSQDAARQARAEASRKAKLVAGLKAKVERLSDELDAATRRSDKLKSKNSRLTRLLSLRDAVIEELRDRAQAQPAPAESSPKPKTKCKPKDKQAKPKTKQLRTEVQRQRTVIERLKGQLAQAREELDVLLSSSNSSSDSAKLSRLEQELQRKQRLHEAMVKQRTELKATVTSLEAKLESSKAKRAALLARIKVLESRVKDAPDAPASLPALTQCMHSLAEELAALVRSPPSGMSTPTTSQLTLADLHSPAASVSEAISLVEETSRSRNLGFSHTEIEDLFRSSTQQPPASSSATSLLSTIQATLQELAAPQPDERVEALTRALHDAFAQLINLATSTDAHQLEIDRLTANVKRYEHLASSIRAHIERQAEDFAQERAALHAQLAAAKRRRSSTPQ